MDTTLTQQRNRLQSSSTSTATSSSSNSSTSSTATAAVPIQTGVHAPTNALTIESSCHITPTPSPFASTQVMPQSQSSPPPPERISSTSSFVNLLDGFTARVSGDRGQNSAASTPSSTNSSVGAIGAAGGIAGSASIASLTSIGSLGTTANAFYSSIGLAFNSLTSPITAAAAAAQATTAEAAAVVMSAATAISNHLSSPTSGTPPHMDELEDDDEDCDDDDDDDDDDGHVAAPTPKKSWSEIKATVSDMRKQLSNLSSMVPTNVQFRTLSDGRVRCYFLSTPPNAWETTLLYADVNMSNADEPMSSDDANETLVSGGGLAGANLIVGGNGSATIGGASGVFAMNSTASTSSGGGGIGGDIGLPSAGITDWSGKPIPSTSPAASPTMSPLSSVFFAAHQKKSIPRLQWNIVLQQPISSMAAAAGVGGVNAWSREYQLLQERKRLSTWGITSYELHKDSGKIVFPCLNDLYQCLDTGYNSPVPLFPTQLRTCPQWAALDPQICPQNSDLIAYVSGCDVWVTHTVSGHEERLTFANQGRRSFEDDPLSAGVPSYVMQEEFNRYLGYWWQPKSDDGVYRIVYEEVDESDVCLYSIPSSDVAPGETEEYRFPRTGTANAKSKLKLVQFALNESLQISDICIKDLPYSLSAVFPWLEYIVRVGWTPDSKYVWMQAMDRRQQRLDLVLIPLDNFCETYYGTRTSSPVGPTDHSWRSPYSTEISRLQVIYCQMSDTWINVHDLLYFLEITPATVTFLWASEETGFRHLYLVTSSLSSTAVNGFKETNSANGSAEKMATSGYADHGTATNLRTSSVSSTTSSVNMDTIQSTDYIEGITLHPRIINKVALTSGEWEVLGRSLWVDNVQQLVYFLGLRDTPLEKHLYVVSLQRPEHIRLLTEPGYSYLVEFDESCQLMLQVYCNIQRFPSSKIMRVTQTCQSGGVNGIELSLMGFLHEGGKPEPHYCPQIFWPQLPSGEIVYAMVFKPHNFQLGVKYPTVLNVYGGPEVQTVNNTFKGKHHLRMHMLAAQGYCVICIDSRGSRHRGLQFENHIRCRMGQVELYDQVSALRILSVQLGYIDMNRVAIHGWSYGGYLSLMGLVQFPDIFKVAIAGAPVTNWEYYDTGYTERYMDLPHNNKRGYTAGSVLSYIHAFPEEDNRLLLIHGLIDENVHFYHTAQLISALNKANKPYDLHVFPEERHSLRNLESNRNYETKLLSFLQNL